MSDTLADFNDAKEVVERFAELLRRSFSDNTSFERSLAQKIAELLPPKPANGCLRLDDAVRWFAGAFPGLDAYEHDGGVVLFCPHQFPGIYFQKVEKTDDSSEG